MLNESESTLAMNLHLFIILLSFCCSARLANAEPELHYLNYDEAVQIALHDNFDLLALRNQEESFKLRSSPALSPQDPVFSFTKNDIPGFSLTERPAQTVYGINWTLGFP